MDALRQSPSSSVAATAGIDRRRILFLLTAGGVLIAAKGNMRSRSINPTDASYAQAMEVRGAERLLFISGQGPEDANEKVPADFRSQCELAWANVQAQLHAADMTLDHLVKLTIFLSDRKHRRESYEVRHAVLGDRSPAMTIIICGIYDESWLLEIEAIAAA